LKRSILRFLYGQGRIKVDAIDGAALGPFVK